MHLLSMSIYLNFFIIAVAHSHFDKEVVNIKSPISSVATDVESERPYYTLVAPAPQSVGMNVKNASYFINRQQRRYFITDPRPYHRFFPPASKIGVRSYLGIFRENDVSFLFDRF